MDSWYFSVRFWIKPWREGMLSIVRVGWFSARGRSDKRKMAESTTLREKFLVCGVIEERGGSHGDLAKQNACGLIGWVLLVGEFCSWYGQAMGRFSRSSPNIDSTDEETKGELPLRSPIESLDYAGCSFPPRRMLFSLKLNMGSWFPPQCLQDAVGCDMIDTSCNVKHCSLILWCLHLIL